jgi:radical SAM protein with 4Fe4S-binding SPASM domain
MQGSVTINDLIGGYQKFILTCPLSVARLENELLKDVNAIRPYRWQELEKKPPYELVFHVTEFCNALCSFCCYRYSKPRHRMSNEIFFKAAEEYYHIGGKRITLNALTGEPLLDPLFFEKTSFLKSLGKFEKSGFTTNGILLCKDEVVESVLDSGLSYINISTSGFNKAIYEKVMGVKKYDEFLSGVIKLLKRNQESGNPISIQFGIRGLMDNVDTEDFYTKILPLINSSNGRATISFLRLYTDWIGQIKKEDLPINCGFQESHIRIKPCEHSFNLGVLANGDLRLCHCQFGEEGRVDALAIGDIKSNSLADVWYSEATKKVRRTTYGSNANDICRKCRTYSSICHHFHIGRWEV